MNKHEEARVKAQASLANAQSRFDSLDQDYTVTALSLGELKDNSASFGEDSKAINDKLENLTRNKVTALHNIQVLEGLVTTMEANELKSLAPAMPASLPTDDNGGSGSGSGNSGSGDSVKAFYINRQSKQFDEQMESGDIKSLLASNDMKHIYGDNHFLELDYNLEKAFRTVLFNRGRNSPKEIYMLTPEYPHPNRVITEIQGGASVEDVYKSVHTVGVPQQVGFAVPPIRNNRIIQKVMGLTAMRRAGATVITDSNSDIFEWFSVPSSSDIFTSSMTDANVEIPEIGPTQSKQLQGELKKISIHDFGFNIQISTKLLQMGNVNFDKLFDKQIAEVRAFAEERAFLTGDGLTGPTGLLPGGLNPAGFDQLVEINSGDANLLKYDGLRALWHGIPVQYRNNPVAYIGNDDVARQIEKMVDGNGQYFQPSVLKVGGDFLGGTWWSTEFTPAIAANALPVLYGDFSGYYIIDSANLRIGQFQDTQTGLSRVQFEILWRQGGGVIEPWRIAAQKVAV